MGRVPDPVLGPRSQDGLSPLELLQVLSPQAALLNLQGSGQVQPGFQNVEGAVRVKHELWNQDLDLLPLNLFLMCKM